MNYQINKSTFLPQIAAESFEELKSIFY